MYNKQCGLWNGCGPIQEKFVDSQRREQLRKHRRENENDAGFQEDKGDRIELERACTEVRRGTRTEESAEEDYNRVREQRTIENKMEKRVETRHEK